MENLTLRTCGSLRVILQHLLQQLLHVRLIDVDEPLLLAAEVVDVAGVNVKPEGMNVDAASRQPLPHKIVAGNVLELLEGVDLREFVLHGEAVFGVNVCHEPPHGGLCLGSQSCCVLIMADQT